MNMDQLTALQLVDLVLETELGQRIAVPADPRTIDTHYRGEAGSEIVTLKTGFFRFQVLINDDTRDVQGLPLRVRPQWPCVISFEAAIVGMLNRRTGDTQTDAMHFEQLNHWDFPLKLVGFNYNAFIDNALPRS